MQTVYATHLPLPDSAGTDALDAAASVMVAWVEQRFGVELAPLSGGEARANDVDVRWQTLLGQDRGLISLTLDQLDQYDAAWRWRTYVDLGVEEGCTWLRTRVHLYSPIEGRLTSPKVQAGRPGIVRALADALDIRIDNWGLGEWRPVSRRNVSAYLDFLLTPERQLPVVTLSSTSSGEPFLDPAHIADRLLGLAHVVVVDSDAAFAITDRIGKTLSCFNGAVRIYWPGFTVEDDPYFHRLYVGGSLTHYGRDGLATELFGSLGRLAGLSLDQPALRRSLKIERRAQELRAHEAERAQVSARLNKAASNVDDEIFDQFVEEYEQVRTHADELEMAALEAETEIETLRKERDDARRQTVEVARAINAEAKAAVVEVPEEPPASVLEAVRRAEERAKNTTYLPEAFASAEESQYEDPERVADDLRLIDEIAQDWASGELTAGPHTAFKQRCSGYRDGIGQKASTQYAVDYTRTLDGEVIMLGPHVRRGIGAVAAIMRIYMYFDTANTRIVIGHVGRKLRDDSNRN